MKSKNIEEAELEWEKKKKQCSKKNSKLHATNSVQLYVPHKQSTESAAICVCKKNSLNREEEKERKIVKNIKTKWGRVSVLRHSQVNKFIMRYYDARRRGIMRMCLLRENRFSFDGRWQQSSLVCSFAFFSGRQWSTCSNAADSSRWNREEDGRNSAYIQHVQRVRDEIRENCATQLLLQGSEWCSDVCWVLEKKENIECAHNFCHFHSPPLSIQFIWSSSA